MLERWGGFALDAGLVLAFGIVVIAAGHGAAPIGYLMFQGSIRAWCWPVVAGWAAIALLLPSEFVTRNGVHLVLTLTGLGLTVLSWWFFIRESEALTISVLSSIPFFALLLVRFWITMYQGT
jgi:hypothetical protein